MTNQEAIELIKVAQAEIEWNCPMDYAAAFDLAIKALEQEPCGKDINVPATDAISRQAVLDQTYLWSKDEFLRVTNPFDYLRKRINSLPPVTPQQKIGHWIMTGDYYTGAYGCIDYVECSCCHAESLEEGDYCPNCGAKMAESEGEE